MTYFLTFLLAAFLRLFTVGAVHPAADDMPDSIRQALQTGQAHQLAAHFDETIELIIDSESVNFSSVRAGHAELILDTFFRKHPPQSFRYLHQGSSDGVQYGTGTYESSGETFSVYVLLPRVGPNQYRINTLQFRQTA